MDNDRLAATAAERLLTRRELLDEGYSSNAIQRERLAGRLTVIRRGIYTPADAFHQLGLELQHASTARGVALAAPGVVVSHISAAVLHGLPVRPAGLGRVHVTRAGAGGGSTSARRVVHSGRLCEDDIVEIAGSRTTSVARTIVDLARTEPFEASVIAADCAFHRIPEIVGEVADILAASRHHRGHTSARRALLFADGRTESVGESRLRIFVHRVGLPSPEPQCEIFGARGDLVGRADFGLASHGALLEFDGMVKYGRLLSPHRTELQVLKAEKAREEMLWGLGWQVARVVWADFNDPETLEARIRTALARGVRALAVNPIIGSVHPLPKIQMPRG